jgi:hypothetical protein
LDLLYNYKQAISALSDEMARAQDLLDNATSISSAFDAETYKTYMVTFTASIASTEEAGTGIYAFDSTDAGHYHMDPDTDNAGTHEFTYPE